MVLVALGGDEFTREAVEIATVELDEDEDTMLKLTRTM